MAEEYALTVIESYEKEDTRSRMQRSEGGGKEDSYGNPLTLSHCIPQT